MQTEKTEKTREVYLGSLGRTSKRDPYTWGLAMGRKAKHLGRGNTEIRKGPFGTLEAYWVAA